MGFQIISAFAQVTGILVVDKNGNLVLLPEGVEPRPGDIVLGPPSETTDLSTVNVVGEDGEVVELSVDDDNEEIDGLIAQIEAGVDPTSQQSSDFEATAAGEAGGSSLTVTQSIDATRAELLADTLFITAANNGAFITRPQSFTLSQLLDNIPPAGFDGSATIDENQFLSSQVPAGDDPDGRVDSYQLISNVDGGELNFNSDGSYTFDPGNSFDDLSLGEEQVVSFTYVVVDDAGDQSDPATISITLIGSNDAAQIGGISTGAVTEDDTSPTLTDTGTLTIADVDGADEESFNPESVTSPEGTLGELTITPEGEWTYNVPNDDVQYLGEGETKEETFTVQSEDGTEHVVTVTIVGTNDAAEIGGTDTGTVTEDDTSPTLTDTGTLTIADVDGADEESFNPESVTSPEGTLGELTITPEGEWTYNVPNDDVQYLGEGETKEETFTVQSEDGTEHVVTVTIVGTNDAAEIGGTDTGTVTEDDTSPTLTDTGTLTIADVDGADEESFNPESVTSPEGTLGELTITPEGEWTYNVPNEDVQYLGEGETKEETFTVQSEDGTEHVVTVTIVGTNDAAEIGGTDTGTVTEDDTSPTLTDTGTLTIADVDGADEESFNPESVTSPEGTLGELTITPEGEWTYNVPNDDVQYLGEGETKEETFTVQSEDGTEHVITVTIVGVNDAAEIAGVDTGLVTEDDTSPTLTDTGTLTIADVDGADEESFNPESVTSPEGTLGELTITPEGEWTYNVPNDDVQYLGEGETKEETFTVQSEDGTEHVITVTIVGVNDAAEIAGVDTGLVTEDDTSPTLTDTGTLTIDDVDGADEESFNPESVTSPEGTLGELTITPEGEWTYNVPNDDVQYLGEGETKEETFTVQSEDGTEHVITVTIVGVNDAAEIAGVDTGLVTEDDTSPTLTDTGTLTIDDVDGADEESFNPESVTSPEGTLGELTITPEGEWTYNVPNDDVQYLGEGETKEETFTVQSEDGTEHVITVTIVGVNDAAEIAGVDTGLVTEDDTSPTLTDTGTLTIDDVDGADEESFNPESVTSPEGTLGELTITPEGEWTYNVPNEDVQYLGEGETKEETFTVQSEDGTEHVITVTIVGVNDAAEIAGVDTGLVTEDDTSPTLTDTGTLTIDDVDGADEESFNPESVTSPEGTLGELTITPEGEWTYNVPNDDVQYLGEGETKEETFTVQSEDGTEHVITVTIVGVNDAAEIAGVDTGLVTEDDTSPTLTDTGTLTIDDVDGADEESFNPESVTSPEGTLGELTITPEGEWTYNVPNDDVQYLGEGETKEETFTVQSEDGTEHVITVTIVGVNDAAEIAGVDTGLVTEDDTSPTLTDTGTLTIDDVDGADEESFNPESVTSPEGTLGELTITPEGEWTYNVPNEDVQYLGEGETKEETFTVQSEDGTEHVITVTIVGVNDAPIIAGDDIGAVLEDANDPILTDEGSLRISEDIDINEIGQFDPDAVTSPEGTLGTLTITPEGDWTYNVPNEDVQYLDEGETKEEVFTVRSDDGTEHIITVTITGINDAAEITGVDTGTVTEDTTSPTLTDTGVLELTDADGAAQESFNPDSVTSPEGTLGELTITPEGEWTYNVPNEDVQYLGEGETKEEVFTIQSEDGTEHVITVTIVGVNDAAEIAGVDTGLVIEDSATPNLIDNGVLTITDTDGADEAVFVPSSVLPADGVLGQLTLTTDGTWNYSVPNEDVQYLDEGETKEEVFTVQSEDGTEHVITVTIVGVNDAAEIAGVDTGLVTEDDSTPNLTDTGTLTISDVDGDEQAVFNPNSVVPSDGALGSLTIDEDGNWTYDVPNDDVQYLAEGETKEETFTVQSEDGTEHVITVTIVGVNDAAEIAGDDIGIVVEDTASPTLNDTGVLTIDDADTGEAIFNPNSVVPAVGVLGALTITEAGEWSYDVDNSAVQYLGQGETKEEIFTVQSEDGTEHVITVTIVGINDTVEISGDDIGDVLEDETSPTLTDTGSLRISEDVDINDLSEFDPDSVTSPDGTLGTLTITPEGDWTYNVPNEDVQYLDEGETKVEVFTVFSDDGSASQTITVTITGINDAAEITGVDTGTVTEDTTSPTLTDTGTLIINDADGDEQAVFDPNSVVPSDGALGTLTIDEDGNWTYDVPNEDVQYLAEGETKEETFTVQSEDGTEHVITVTIVGVNDAAEIAGVDTGLVTEDTATPDLTDTGVLTITDGDADEAVFVPSSVQPADGVLGELTLTTDGTWNYSVPNDDVQYLDEGETKEEVFTVQSEDGTEHVITVTIVGVNDAAEIAGVDTGLVTEDDSTPNLTDTGTLTISDADGDEQAVFNPNSVVPSDGALGSLTIDEDGNWTYDVPNDDVQYLAEGETKEETFTVQSEDGTEHVITVTIVGVNDAAEIAGVDTGLVTEDTSSPTLNDTGVLTIDDADTGEAVFNPSSVVPAAGVLGALTITEAGEWSYDVDNSAVQYLGEGETKEEVFTVQSEDGTEHVITVTIVGVNDTVEISGEDVGDVLEDETSPTLTDIGSLRISEDVDINDLSEFDPDSVTSPDGTLGTLTITPEGDWTYNVPNEDVQYLDEGETKVEVFTVFSDDGSASQTITVTITGINDAAEITGVDTGTVTEDTTSPTLTDTGTLIINDADGDEQAVFDPNSVVPSDGALGTLTIDEDGNWTYDVPNEDVQYLAEGETKEETFTVQSEDGTEHVITVTIVGVNDAAEIAGVDTGLVTEDTATPDLTDTGVLTITDGDADEAVFVPSSVQPADGVLGELTLTTDGTWNYSVPNDDVQYLDEGETKEEVFTVQSEDGTEHVITVTIVGVNDAAEIAGVDTGLVTEDDSTPNLTDTGTLTISDADGDEQAVFNPNSVVPSDGALGSLTIDEDGNWTYDVPNEDVKYLAEGETKEETFTVQSADGTEHVITVTIVGVNDAAEFAGDVTVALDETNAPLTTDGVLVVTDIDGENKVEPVVNRAGEYGVFNIDADGAWTYEANESYDELSVGDSLVDTFEVVAADGTATTVTITINGTNDKPEISGPDSGVVTENDPTTAQGSLLVSDVDQNDAHTWSIDGVDATSSTPASVAGTFGGITLTDSGDWEYTLDDSKVEFLAAGETRTETFEVIVDDGNGGTDTQDITITINGTNDIPEIDGDILKTVTEDAAIQLVTGDLSVDDVDTTDSHTWSLVDENASQGRYGEFSLNPATGTWEYQLDNAAAQELQHGQQFTEEFLVQVDDDNGGITEQLVTVNVVGTNDQPTIIGDDDGLVVEDIALTVDGQLSADDVDISPLSDNHTWSIQGSAQGQYGSITVNADGKWEYTLDPDKSQHFEQGVTYAESTFTILVDDNQGQANSTDTIDVNVNIVGQNDDPVIEGVVTGTTREDIKESVSGLLGSGDPDENEAHTWTVAGDSVGEYGSISVDANGKWTYNLETTPEQSAKVQALGHGNSEDKYETFTIQVVDKYGRVDTEEVTIRVRGTNDRPEIEGDITGTVAEDNFSGADSTTPVITTGTMTVADIDTNDTHTWKFDTMKGDYGTIAIDADGNWTYTLDNDNPLVQRMLETESLTDTFVVQAVDDSGTGTKTSVAEDLVITIVGTNDIPTLSGETFGSVIEATPSASEATGKIVVADIDIMDTHTWKVVGEDETSGISDGIYGTLEVDGDGQWTYVLDNTRESTLSIPPGANDTDTFQVEVTDTAGATTVITVSIDIAGSNTAPDINMDGSFTIVEDAVPSVISGMFDGGDPDRDDVVEWEVIGSSGQYGELSIAPDGSWTYTLDNSNPAVNALDAHDIAGLQDSIQVQATDQHGLSCIKTVTIDIDGANDAPDLSGALTKTISEDASSVTGQLQDGDPDADNISIWGPSSLVGEHGNFVMSSTGQWTYFLSNQEEEVQALNPGETLVERFEVTVEDSYGETSTKDVVVTIQGSNDLPVLTGDTVGLFVENQTSTVAEGKLTLTDIDNDDMPSFTEVTPIDAYQGNFGTFSIDSAGNWTFDPYEELLESLNEGEMRSESFEVIGTDLFGGVISQDVTIDIRGTNDIPEIHGVTTGTVVEHGGDLSGGALLRATGQLVASDVDNNSEAVSWTIEEHPDPSLSDYGKGQYGDLTLGNNGEWTYILNSNDPDTIALEPGEVGIETFYVTVTDEKGGTSETQLIKIDVLGWAHDSTNGGGTTANPVLDIIVMEDLDITKSIDDLLQPNEVITGSSALSGGAYGDLILNPTTNEWEYQLNNDSPVVQGLHDVDTRYEVWTVDVDTDGDGVADKTYNVNVDIKGNNDKPEITVSTDTTFPQNDVPVVGEAVEYVVTQLSGVLGVEDIDINEFHTWSIDPADAEGTYGDLVLNPSNGAWEYFLTEGGEVSNLKPHEEAYETFTVTVTDIDGLTDTRDIQIRVVGSAENVTLEDTTLLTISAVEDTDDQDSSSTDGVISQAGALGMPEGLGDEPTWTLVDGKSAYGDFSINTEGEWEFVLDNNSTAVQALQDGQSVTDTFTVFVVDQYGKTVVDENGDTELLEIDVVISGTNDAPVISGTSTASTLASNTGSVGGNLQPGDVDTIDSHVWTNDGTNSSGTIIAQYGTFTLNPNGSWNYDVNESNLDVIALHGRDPADTLTETFTVQVEDDAGLTDTQEITVTINGVNETPTLSGDVTAALSEDNVTLVEMKLTTADEDNGDTVLFDVKSLNGTYGEFNIDAAGNWSYELYDEAQVQALGAGVQVTETFIVKAKDDLGASVTEQVTVTVTGTNDKPMLAGEVTGIVEESAASSATGKLAVQDLDKDDTMTFEVLTPASFGELTVDDEGVWTYIVDENHISVDELGVGDELTDTIQVVVKDSQGEYSDPIDINVVINGTNDAPEIVDIGEQNATEDTNVSLSGTLDSGDVDISDSATWSITSEDDRGVFAINPSTGAWTFELNNDLDEVQELAVGESIVLTYTVKVMDEQNVSDTQDISIRVFGNNDTPEVLVSSVTSGDVADNGAQTDSGIINIDDTDVSDTHTYVLGNGAQAEIGDYGQLVLNNTTGAWEYTIDNDKVAPLGDETVNDVFTVTVDDGNGGTVDQDITIAVTGQNDKPVLTGEVTGNVEESAASSATGQLMVQDVDTGDTATFEVLSSGNFGELTVDDEGVWTYIVDANNIAVDGLSVGDTITDIAQVAAKDSQGEYSDPISIGIVITGTNDDPQVSGTSVTTGEVADDGAQTDSGMINIDDDINDTHTYVLGNGAQAEIGDYGQLVLNNTTGAWEYTIDSDKVAPLGDETVNDVFTVTVDDGNGGTVDQDITIAVTGHNEAPVITGDVFAGNVSEANTSTVAQGLITATDTELDTLTFSLDSAQSTYGEFVVNSASGAWSFQLDEALADTIPNGGVIETFVVKVSDGDLSVNQVVTITIDSVDDAPVITNVNTGDVQEYFNDEASGQATATDVDTDADDLSWQILNPAGGVGNFGSLSLNAQTGAWVYTLIAGSTSTLAANEVEADTFEVEVFDGTSRVTTDVTINVVGSNDIQGTNGEDLLIATSDDDIFWGDPSNAASMSSDTFEWDAAALGTANDPSQDVINDFDVNSDVINLTQVFGLANNWSMSELVNRIIVTESNSDANILINNESGELVQIIALKDIDLTTLFGTDVSSESNEDRLNLLIESGQLVVAESTDQTLVGTDDEDILTGGDGNDTLSGDKDDDQLFGGAGNDTLFGDKDDDQLFGGAGNDTLDGGKDDDELFGGDGNDILTGGKGDDIFIFNEISNGEDSVETVTDFDIKDDLLDISDLMPEDADMTDLLDRIVITVNDDVNDNNDTVSTVIDVEDNQGTQTQIVLEGVGWDQLNVNNQDVSTLGTSDLLSIMQNDLNILKVE